MGSPDRPKRSKMTRLYAYNLNLSYIDTIVNPTLLSRVHRGKINAKMDTNPSKMQFYKGSGLEAFGSFIE